MTVRCELIKTSVIHGNRTEEDYGLRFYDKADVGYTVEMIYDISINRSSVKKLIALVNSSDISPLHIDDIVEDYLSNF